MDLDYLQSLMGGDEIAEEESGYQDIWVIGETEADELTPLTRAIVGKARELANGLGVYVWGVLFGQGLEPAAERMIRFGADTVILFDDPSLAEFGLEPYSEALGRRIEGDRPEIILFGATSLAGELAPRLAARFDAPCFTRCLDLGIDEMQRTLLATVPRLGGAYFEMVASPSARPQFATVQAGVLPEPFADEYRFGEVLNGDASDLPAPRVEQRGPAGGALPKTRLADARVIVCAGRGLVDAGGVEEARKLADALGAHLAGTRGAFDEGWIDEASVIGMGGITVKPELYIGCGVSGAIQHLMSMEKAGFIVAINTDRDADLVHFADVSVVGDAREVLAALNAALADGAN